MKLLILLFGFVAAASAVSFLDVSRAEWDNFKVSTLAANFPIASTFWKSEISYFYPKPRTEKNSIATQLFGR